MLIFSAAWLLALVSLIAEGHLTAVAASERKIREDLRDNPEARLLMRRAGYLI